MRVRSTLVTLALSALTVFMLLGVTAQVSVGETPAADVAPMLLESASEALAGDECTAETFEAAEVEDVGAAYECPNGIPYCRTAAQCADHCGGGFEVCFQGCCACAG